MDSHSPDLPRVLPYRVLDLADESGMLCGRLFAALGAEVIKVEPPQGDSCRRRSPFYHDKPGKESSLLWLAYNGGKKSITLDVSTVEGKDVFRKLATSADVMIETSQPGRMVELGLGYELLQAVNPGLVMISITQYGQSGPCHEASDLAALATGGLLFTTGDNDRPPVRPGIDLSFWIAGIQAAIAGVTALYNRARTGLGEQVDVSIHEGVASTSWIAPNLWILNSLILNREGAKAQRASIVVRHVWQCQDGYVSWRLFTGSDADKTEALVQWMDSRGIAGELKEIDWKTVDMSEVTQEQIDRWEQLWSAFFLLYSKRELYSEAVRRGIMLFPVNDFADLGADEQLKSRDFWRTVSYPCDDKGVVLPGAPFRSDVNWWRSERAPLLGEHNREIYHGLGYSDKSIMAMKVKNVI